MAIFSHGKVNGLLTKQDFQRAAYHSDAIVMGISAQMSSLEFYKDEKGTFRSQRRQVLWD
ncbi:hypothetical protein RJ640_022226 [Escallonia rubra]|uniref:Uncharacterized protein n=1 Tax=Escallonia rubra TaxID=112253 RepID=A0AA88TZG8_9ASTE|nr:hypothetical protein RJ640_022226 [Escallonia rubra]